MKAGLVMRATRWRRRRRASASAGLVVACAMLFASTASAAVSGTYRGHTSQHRRVVIAIRHGRIGHDKGRIYYRERCHPRSHLLTGWNGIAGRLRHGRLHISGTGETSYGRDELGRQHASIRFVVRGRKLRGSVRMREVLFSRRGATLAHCSAHFSFTARRR